MPSQKSPPANASTANTNTANAPQTTSAKSRAANSKGRQSKRPKPRARRSLSRADVKELLGAGESGALLRALGLTTERGGASADSHRKIKQIAHLISLVEPGVLEILERSDAPVLVDAAAGKAYVGLALYEVLLRSSDATLVAVESRTELAERVRAIAGELAMERVSVCASTIADAELPERVHHVFALHACDTATDEAIACGISRRADHIAVVPCCQAEVARQLKSVSPDPLFGCALHRREFGAHLTNVVRALALRACGYQVTVTELIGWEHSLKNEIIVARRVGRYHQESQVQLRELLGRFQIKPTLVDLLGERLWST